MPLWPLCFGTKTELLTDLKFFSPAVEEEVKKTTEETNGKEENGVANGHKDEGENGDSTNGKGDSANGKEAEDSNGKEAEDSNGKEAEAGDSNGHSEDVSFSNLNF